MTKHHRTTGGAADRSTRRWLRRTMDSESLVVRKDAGLDVDARATSGKRPVSCQSGNKCGEVGLPRPRADPDGWLQPLGPLFTATFTRPNLWSTQDTHAGGRVATRHDSRAHQGLTACKAPSNNIHYKKETPTGIWIHPSHPSAPWFRNQSLRFLCMYCTIRAFQNNRESIGKRKRNAMQ